MLAALISWPMIGERPGLHTVAAILATLLGVGIIVSDGLGTGNLTGDIFALICAGLLALTLTLTRRAGKDLSLAPGFGGIGLGRICATDGALGQHRARSSGLATLQIPLVVVPLAGITLWLAPRFITAPQVAMFYLP